MEAGAKENWRPVVGGVDDAQVRELRRRLFCLTELNAPEGSPLIDPRLVFLGADEHGELLEVMAIETETGGLLIIHAQRTRARYLEFLKEGL